MIKNNTKIIPVIMPDLQERIWIQSNKITDLYTANGNFTLFNSIFNSKEALTDSLITQVNAYTNDLSLISKAYQALGTTSMGDIDYSDSFLPAQSQVSFFKGPDNYEGISFYSDTFGNPNKDFKYLDTAFKQFSSAQEKLNTATLNAAYSIANMAPNTRLNANIPPVMTHIFDDINASISSYSTGIQENKEKFAKLSTRVSPSTDAKLLSLESDNKTLATQFSLEKEHLQDSTIAAQQMYNDFYAMIEKSPDWEVVKASLINTYLKGDTYYLKQSPKQLINTIIDRGAIEITPPKINITDEVAHLDEQESLNYQGFCKNAIRLGYTEQHFQALVGAYNTAQNQLENQSYRDKMLAFSTSGNSVPAVAEPHINSSLFNASLTQLNDTSTIYDGNNKAFFAETTGKTIATDLEQNAAATAGGALAGFATIKVAGAALAGTFGAPFIIGGSVLAASIAGGYAAVYGYDYANEKWIDNWVNDFIESGFDLYDSPNASAQQHRLNQITRKNVAELENHPILSPDNHAELSTALGENPAYKKYADAFKLNQSGPVENKAHQEQYTKITTQFVSLLENISNGTQPAIAAMLADPKVIAILQEEQRLQTISSPYPLAWSRIDMKSHFISHCRIALQAKDMPEVVDAVQLAEKRSFLQTEILLRSNIILEKQANGATRQPTPTKNLSASLAAAGTTLNTESPTKSPIPQKQLT